MKDHFEMCEYENNKNNCPKALIKLGEKKYMDKYVNQGEMKFSVAREFSEMQEGLDKVADNYEGSAFGVARDLYIAPVVSDDDDGIVYGKTIKIADKFNYRINTETIQHIPFHCLYSYDYSTINNIVRLDDYEQIRKAFPSYDTAVIIYKPLIFLNRLKEKYKLCAQRVIYTDGTPLEDDIEEKIQCLFYKRTNYREQNEFRVVLPELRTDNSKIIRLGSLNDIAYSLPLTMLKHGVIIADNKTDFEHLKQQCEKSGCVVGKSGVL